MKKFESRCWNSNRDSTSASRDRVTLDDDADALFESEQLDLSNFIIH